TEVYRFGNAIVDDWEGKVNAWPLDEGLIDYVDASYGVTKAIDLCLLVRHAGGKPSVFGGFQRLGRRIFGQVIDRR
ncbi:MAG: imelysin family protein, partial [Pseudomonadota bacterium]